jgi:histidinol dehydrogenase
VQTQVILVSTSQQLIDEVENEIEIQLDALPRKDLAVKAIANSKLIFVENTIALALINEYGPEHFIICTQSEEYYSDGVYNAGSVL